MPRIAHLCRPCRWLALLLLALALALAFAVHLLRASPAVPSVLPELPELAVGDWIFRSGTASDSLVIRQLSGSDYSHIGMVVANSPQVLIVHASTDDQPEHPDQVLLSSLEEFVHPSLAHSFAIARPTFLDVQQKTDIARLLLAQRGQAFFIQPRGEAHRYCTTLLADAIRSEAPGFDPVWSAVNLAFFRGDYLFPRAFAEHAQIRWIYRPQAH